MRIIIETVSHNAQRYDTVGDWQFRFPQHNWQGLTDKDLNDPHCELYISVSRMADWRSEALVAVHELVEALLCQRAGITTEQVDAWDISDDRLAAYVDEPGDDPSAPYHRQHVCADIIERILCEDFGMEWSAHNENADNPHED